MANTNVKDILNRYDEAVSRRTKYNSLMQEAGQYVWPSAQDMVRNSQQTEGLLRTVELYDSTALMAAYTMTSGIFSYLMPVGARWFGFVPTLPELKEEPNIQEWISKAIALTHEEIWRSNFQREMFITIRSMIVFGTGVISVKKVGDEIVFESHHIGFMFFEENSKGEIDTVYRQIFYNARQAAQEFGRKNLPADVLKALVAEKLTEMFEFVHVVAPNSDFDKSKIGSSVKRVKSLYIYKKTGKIVKQGGFNELPYLIARFSRAPQEIMGRGPAIELLPEIKMLNRMKRSFIYTSELAGNPPLIVEDDGVVGQPVTGPGGMIYMRAGAMEPHALQTGINSQLNAEVIRDQQLIVKEGFFNNLFRTLEGLRNMTATETQIRKEDDLVIVAPAITSLQKEIFSPLIERVLNLLRSVNKVPEPPVSFDFDIVYQGRLALAMSNIQTNAIEATLAKWAPYTENTNVLDNVEFDKSFRLTWLNGGAPAEGLKNYDEMIADREATTQLQVAAAQAEIAESASKAYRNVEKAAEPGSLAEAVA